MDTQVTVEGSESGSANEEDFLDDHRLPEPPCRSLSKTRTVSSGKCNSSPTLGIHDERTSSSGDGANSKTDRSAEDLHRSLLVGLRDILVNGKALKDYLLLLSEMRRLVLTAYELPEEPHSPFTLIIATGGTLAQVPRGELPQDHNKYTNDPVLKKKLVPMPPSLLLAVLRDLPYFKQEENSIESYDNVAWGATKAPKRYPGKNQSNRDPPSTPSTPTPRFMFLGLHSPIDSTDAQISHWNMLAAIVAVAMDCYSNQLKGIVIIHGTDTLAHTAASLSFQLWNVNIPIVVTGSQLPITAPISDAPHNLCLSCEIAKGPLQDFNDRAVAVLCGVFVFFNYHLMVGTRVVKSHSLNFDAFTSPNCGSIARYRGKWIVHTRLVQLLSERTNTLRDKFSQKARVQFVHPSVCIYVLQLHPGFESSLHVQLQGQIVRLSDFTAEDRRTERFKRFVQALWGSYHGILLCAYGCGNVPSAVTEAVLLAVNTMNLPVAMTVQSLKGGTEITYDVSISDQEGIVSLQDCTQPAAYAKLAYAISIAASNRGKQKEFRHKKVNIEKTPFGGRKVFSNEVLAKILAHLRIVFRMELMGTPDDFDAQVYLS